MSKRILVTGGKGFIGQHLVAHLAKSEQTLHLLEGDIRDAETVRKAVRDCDLIYHLAAKTSFSGRNKKRIFDINLHGTQVLAQAAAQAGVSRFIFCSTGGVYGSRFKGPIAEDGPKKPNTAYRTSKWKAEQWLTRFSEESGLPVVVARPASVTGPGAKGWLGLLRAIKRGGFRYIAPGTHQLHACDVINVAEGLRLCGETPGIEGEAFNLVNDDPSAFRDLVSLVAEQVGSKLGRPSIRWPFAHYNATSEAIYHLTGYHLPRAHTYEILLRERTFDIKKAQRQLGYAPTIGHKESLARMTQWAMDEGLL